MNSRFGIVKNPLTIIAIFAGTAEVSGTAILPFLQTQNQTLYVWFLMIFPLTIVVLFFMTLNWNYKVLYAPSDFANEDNFINILQKASSIDLLYKENRELSELNVSVEEVISVDTNVSTVTDTISNNAQSNFSQEQLFDPTPLTVEDLVEKLGLANDELSNKEIRKSRNQVLQKIQRKAMNEIRLSTKLAIEKLEKELNVTIETAVKIQSNNNTYIFDGVIRQNNKLTGIEVKFFRDLSPNSSVAYKIIDPLLFLYRSLADEQRKDFSVIFVIVTDEIKDDVVARIDNDMKRLPFPVAVKCYEFDSLIDELIRNIA